MTRLCELAAISLICTLGLCSTVEALPKRPAWVIVIHGGAASLPDNLSDIERQQLKDTLNAALRKGGELLEAGGSSLDAVQAAIRVLEDSGRLDAGRGSVFDHDGGVELDAAIMNGADRRAGAVASVRHFANPVDLARLVMERTPHVLIVGPGAETFAAEQGIKPVPDGYFDNPWSRVELEEALRAERTRVPSATREAPHGTVGAVALDARGHLAAATSTGGTNAKRVGRVGDSPLIGSGTYAEDGVCAVSATGKGEFFIRVAAAHDVCSRVRYAKQSIEQAAQATLAAVAALGGSGGMIVLGADGSVAVPHTTRAMLRGEWRAGGQPDVVVANDVVVSSKTEKAR